MTSAAQIPSLLPRVNRENIWDTQPVFCFTSDMDWASEAVLDEFFALIPYQDIKLTVFVTHASKIITDLTNMRRIQRGIHPNFLPGSSHGNSFPEVIETCHRFAPEATGFRSHRLFDVTDITHPLMERGFRWVSNLGTIMATGIRPVLHESGLVHFPIFFEDAGQLWSNLGLDIIPYLPYFTSPGLKVIDFHPFDMVFNSPSFAYRTDLKNSCTREEFQHMDAAFILRHQNYRNPGIRDTILDIITFARKNHYPICSLDEVYQKVIA